MEWGRWGTRKVQQSYLTKTFRETEAANIQSTVAEKQELSIKIIQKNHYGFLLNPKLYICRMRLHEANEEYLTERE